MRKFTGDNLLIYSKMSDVWFKLYKIKLHIRINGKTPKEIGDCIRDYGIESYLITQEVGHCHGIVGTNKTDTSRYDGIRKCLRDGLGLIGNKSYSISVIRDVVECGKYILKEDGDYVHYNMDTKFIDKCKKTTFNPDKKKMSKELDDLNYKYLEDKGMSIESYCEEFILLKVKYNQSLYNNHIKAHCQKMAVKKNSEYARLIAENLFSRLM